jgi:two-component system CheB/CheR fusion protein
MTPDLPNGAPDPNGTPPAADGEIGASGDVRLTEPPDAAQQPRLPFPVVGLGASAGGLEAYTEFLDATPSDSGMAFVLVQHLPPDRESLVADILSRHTPMPVAQVEDGQAVEPDHVYVIRPGHTLTLRDGRLHLGPPLAARGHGRPVDDFFRSLAEEQQQRAVAVVLSGMGSNGTAGAEAVKAVGGLVVAQDPESAKYPSMPRSLVDANLADFILRPAEIPDTLIRYARHPYAASEAAAELLARRDQAAFGEILAVLRTRTRHDFAGYRKATLLRRIQRRMGLTQATGMGEYARLLRQTAAEVSALADDLLIHVTGFFRDPDAWEAMREKVIDPLADERPDGGPVRAWVAACATGEEAYSLAMLLLEAAEARQKRFDVKVFATDMAERALGHARAGVFPGGIESEVTPERLARFFDRDDAFFHVKKELREAVIFAPQNVLQDPPFSRLDIATCRNLLIYLESETQQRVLALLHFGLRDGGALLLGNSESVGAAEGGDFEPIDKKHRLYRRVGQTRHGTLDFPLPLARAAAALPPPDPGRLLVRPPLAQAAHRLLLEHFAPAAVVTDGQGQIVYFHGDTGRYLDQPRGEPTRDLLALANDQVRGAVRTALQRAVGKDRPVIVRDGLIHTRDGRRRVEVAVVPLERRPDAPHYLVVFTDHPDLPDLPPLGPDAPPDARLADELRRVRDELQSALEEMQTSNEELKASHEEVTSVNEELQSTNEELETSKEELQSLNEELTTVNAQLQAKMGELEATSNDLTALLTSTDTAVLFLDPRFRIRRFTPATRDLLDLIPSDVGRPLADLRRKFADPDLLGDAQRVLDRLAPVEREVQSESGRAYLRRVLPYRTADNRIDGVVVAFVDITERKRAEAALRENMDELTRFNRAMVSREERMVELKKEVNELCRRHGEADRYPLEFEKEAGGGDG